MPESEVSAYRARPQPSVPPRSMTTPLPLNRSNYGLPLRPPIRQLPPAPAISTMQPMVGMDVAQPTPQATPQPPLPQAQPLAVTPINTPQPEVVLPSPAAQPVFQTVPPAQGPINPLAPVQAMPPIVQPSALPLNPSVVAAAQKEQATRPAINRQFRKKVFLTSGTVALIIGVVFWLSSGPLSSSVVTTGAVVSTNLAPAKGVGVYATKIQFDAIDGQLHTFNLYGHKPQASSNLIPGKAVSITYQRGNPNTSGKLWSTVKRPRYIGIGGAGVAVLLLGYGAFNAFMGRDRPIRKSHTEPLTELAV